MPQYISEAPSLPSTPQLSIADMLVAASKRKPHPSTGDWEQSGDLTKFSPVPFRDLAGRTSNTTELLKPGSFGEYRPSRNSIVVDSMPKLHEAQLADANPQYEREINQVYKTAAPTVRPHEFGHAIMDNSLPEEAKKEWLDVYARNIGGNKALGDYRYGKTNDLLGSADNAYHSFSDLFSAWVTNPALLKNLMPEVYEFMAKISTPSPSQGLVPTQKPQTNSIKPKSGLIP